MVTQPHSQVLMRLHKWRPTIPQIKTSFARKKKTLDKKIIIIISVINHLLLVKVMFIVE